MFSSAQFYDPTKVEAYVEETPNLHVVLRLSSEGSTATFFIEDPAFLYLLSGVANRVAYEFEAWQAGKIKD